MENETFIHDGTTGTVDMFGHCRWGGIGFHYQSVMGGLRESAEKAYLKLVKERNK